jgi:hypothetical protein
MPQQEYTAKNGKTYVITYDAGQWEKHCKADSENPQRFGSGRSNLSAPPHPARFSQNGTGQRG